MTEAPPEQPYELIVASSAGRALREILPPAVAAAAIELITGRLLTNPARFGKPLRPPLEGLHGCRLGDYRVVYEIDVERRLVTVLRIKRRADVYGIR